MPCQRHLETPRILLATRIDELRTYTAQNLAVTSGDYEDMIKRLASAILSHQAVLAFALPW